MIAEHCCTPLGDNIQQAGNLSEHLQHLYKQFKKIASRLQHVVQAFPSQHTTMPNSALTSLRRHVLAGSTELSAKQLPSFTGLHTNWHAKISEMT